MIQVLKDGVRTVTADAKPFTETESYFADAKFYAESDTLREILPSASDPKCDLKLKTKEVAYSARGIYVQS